MVFYHLWNRFWPGVSTQSRVLAIGEHSSPAFWLTSVFGFGYLGVHLFFVLSGFCIHAPQALNRFRGKSDFSIKQFTIKRVRRLYPAYLASLFVTSLCLAVFPILLFLWRRQPFSLAEAFGVKDFLVSAAFLQQLFPESIKFNGVYWTLVYEAGFYAFYPLLLFVTRKTGVVPVALALLVAELTLMFHPTPIPFFVLNKYFEWYLGYMAAELFLGEANLPSTGLLAIVSGAVFALGIFSTASANLFIFRDLIFCVAFFGFLLLVLKFSREQAQAEVFAPSPLLRILSHPLPVLIGTFSYSLYLIHVPLIDVIWHSCDLAAKYKAISAVSAEVIPILLIPALFPIAYGFYWCFEKPFLRRSEVPAPIALAARTR